MSNIDSKGQIEKLYEDNYFRLWKMKMQEILIQDKFIKELKGEASMHAHLL